VSRLGQIRLQHLGSYTRGTMSTPSWYEYLTSPVKGTQEEVLEEKSSGTLGVAELLPEKFVFRTVSNEGASLMCLNMVGSGGHYFCCKEKHSVDDLNCGTQHQGGKVYLLPGGSLMMKSMDKASQAYAGFTITEEELVKLDPGVKERWLKQSKVPLSELIAQAEAAGLTLRDMGSRTIVRPATTVVVVETVTDENPKTPTKPAPSITTAVKPEPPAKTGSKRKLDEDDAFVPMGPSPFSPTIRANLLDAGLSGEAIGSLSELGKGLSELVTEVSATKVVFKEVGNDLADMKLLQTSLKYKVGTPSSLVAELEGETVFDHIHDHSERISSLESMVGRNGAILEDVTTRTCDLEEYVKSLAAGVEAHVGATDANLATLDRSVGTQKKRLDVVDQGLDYILPFLQKLGTTVENLSSKVATVCGFGVKQNPRMAAEDIQGIEERVFKRMQEEARRNAPAATGTPLHEKFAFMRPQGGQSDTAPPAPDITAELASGFKALSATVESLKGSLQVNEHQYADQSRFSDEDMQRYVKRILTKPDETLASCYLFLDFHQYLALLDMSDSTFHADMKLQKTIREGGVLDLVEGRAIASHGQRHVKLLHSGTTSLSGSPLSQLKRREDWESPTSATVGFVPELRHRMGVLDKRIEDDIRQLPTAEAKTLATFMWTKTTAYVTALIQFITDFDTRLSKRNRVDPKESWVLSCTVLYGFVEQLADGRGSSAGCLGLFGVDRSIGVAKMLSASLQCHTVMAAHMAARFAEHPSVSTELVHFVLNMSGEDGGQGGVQGNNVTTRKLQADHASLLRRVELITKRLEVAEKDSKK
jgi:hypothetical protein